MVYFLLHTKICFKIHRVSAMIFSTQNVRSRASYMSTKYYDNWFLPPSFWPFGKIDSSGGDMLGRMKNNNYMDSHNIIHSYTFGITCAVRKVDNMVSCAEGSL